MPTDTTIPPEGTVLPWLGNSLRARRKLAQRAVLEAIDLSSPAGQRHTERLRKAGDDPERKVAAYETTIRLEGLTARYQQLLSEGRAP